MIRTYNFNAGPSAMPLEVLQEAQAEFLNYAYTGMSIIEMSHRSADYAAMHAETKALLRELMEICLLYTSPSPRDSQLSRMPSSA